MVASALGWPVGLCRFGNTRPPESESEKRAERGVCQRPLAAAQFQLDSAVRALRARSGIGCGPLARHVRCLAIPGVGFMRRRSRRGTSQLAGTHRVWRPSRSAFTAARSERLAAQPPLKPVSRDGSRDGHFLWLADKRSGISMLVDGALHRGALFVSDKDRVGCGRRRWRSKRPIAAMDRSRSTRPGA